MKKQTLVVIALAIAAFIAIFVTLESRVLRERENAAKPAPEKPASTPLPPATIPIGASPKTADETGDSGEKHDPVFENGVLTARFDDNGPQAIENLFMASKKSLDQLGHFRTGETPGKDSVTIFARAHGDVQITLAITRKTDGNAKYLELATRVGDGDEAGSRKILAKTTDNLN